MSNNESNNETKKVHTRSLIAGLFLLAVGMVLLLNGLDIEVFPSWVFRWPTILIIIGVIIGIKSNFRNPGWLVLITVGGVFMLSESHLFTQVELWKFAPAAGVIVLGIFIVLRALSPKSSHWGHWDHDRWHSRFHRDRNRNSDLGDSVTIGGGRNTTSSGEDRFEAVNIFGGSNRRIFSKHFKGGESTNIFGGTHLDLTQADIDGEAVLEVVCIFGGIKLLVPSNWQIESDMTTILGGMDDKRSEISASLTSGKRLIITGVCALGGIEIRNF
jgi:hypothetical protein